MTINLLKRSKARFICKWQTLGMMALEVLKWRDTINSNSNKCLLHTTCKKVVWAWLTNNSCCINRNRNWPWLNNKGSLLQICMWSKAWVPVLWASKCLPHLKPTWWIRDTDSNSPRNNKWYSCSNCKRKIN